MKYTTLTTVGEQIQGGMSLAPEQMCGRGDFHFRHWLLMFWGAFVVLSGLPLRVW